MERVRRAVLWIAGGWLSLLLALPLGWAATGETWWWLILLRYVPPVVYMLPGLALAVLCCAIRAWRAAALALTGLCVGVWLAAPALHWRGSESEQRPLRVMTYNIEAGVEGIAVVLQVVRDAAPDVLILQEARETSRGAGPDPAPRLQAALPDWTAVRGGRTPELMILARRGSLAKLDEVPLGAGRCALVCRLRREGLAVRLIDVHLNVSTGGRALFTSGWGFREYLVHTAEVRREQLKMLMGMVESSTEPTILAGDFNSTPLSEISGALRERLDDTFQRAGLGFGWTYSARHPLWRVDYIYASRDLLAVRSFVPPVEGSDHRPLVTDLAP